MATIVTRAGKGSPLTHNEVDANFNNLNSDKIESGDTVASLTLTAVDVADKITHTGDTDTSIRFPAADTVTVETAGSERVRVDASGNVGIGTNSPAATLDVAGTGALKVPTGTVAERPTPVKGMLRFNDDADEFEGYNGAAWNSVSNKILQVVTNTSTVPNVSTTSTSYVDITNATATITPSSASNKVLVLWSSYSSNALVSAANVQYRHQLLRGATSLATNIIAAESASGGLQIKGTHAFSMLDAPNTTSAVTYKIQHSVNNASSTGTASNGFLTLMEVAG